MIHITNQQRNNYVITVFIQIVSVFAVCMDILGFIGPFFQSLSEARAAATQVFRLIDEVNLSQLRSYIDNNVFFCLHDIGTRRKYKWNRCLERRWHIRRRVDIWYQWWYWVWCCRLYLSSSKRCVSFTQSLSHCSCWKNNCSRRLKWLWSVFSEAKMFVMIESVFVIHWQGKVHVYHFLLVSMNSHQVESTSVINRLQTLISNNFDKILVLSIKNQYEFFVFVLFAFFFHWISK